LLSHRAIDAWRIGVGLGVAALAASPLAYADATDTSVLVIDAPDGSPTDVDTTMLIPDFLTNITQDQAYAMAAVTGAGGDVVLTPQDISEFPTLSSADIGSETVAENITFLGSSSQFGFVASDVTAATGALADNLGDVQGELITPLLTPPRL
jgi:hypothetical protein